jgi:ankyrin repeat protein
VLYGSVVALDPAAHRRVHDAVADGDLAALRRELEPFGGFPNRSVDAAMGLPLVYAVYHGPLQLIRALLDAGADPDGSDGDGFPPLIAALSPPDRDDVADLLILLLDHGADRGQRGVNDYTPLHCAAASGHPALVELLLERGADPNASTRIDDAETPLEVAEAAGHREVAHILRPRTTLPDWMRAARVGDVVTLRRLVARGQDVDATDGYSQTALLAAAHGGHREAVDFLVSRGADLDRTAKFGLSALMLAVLQRHHKIARALVRAGADTQLRGSGAPDFADKTAADLAEAAGDARLADYIRREGTSG